MEIEYKCDTQFIEYYAPTFATHGSSGIDLRADIEKSVVLAKGTARTLPTGLSFAIPVGFEGQVRSRSGLASRSGIFMLNAPGTIDADYRGTVSVVVANFGPADFTVNPGDRIAQFVICPVPPLTYTKVATLDSTERGGGGFGSTGL